MHCPALPRPHFVAGGTAYSKPVLGSLGSMLRDRIYFRGASCGMLATAGGAGIARSQA